MYHRHVDYYAASVCGGFGGHHVPDMSTHLAQMGNHSACLLHLTQWHEHRQWHKLAHVLAHASRPAVMVLAKLRPARAAAQLPVQRQGHPAHDALLRHVVIWSADACTDDFVLRHFTTGCCQHGQRVNLVRHGPAGRPFKSAPVFAAYATLKAFMPLAAATLGFTALTQDVDACLAPQRNRVPGKHQHWSRDPDDGGGRTNNEGKERTNDRTNGRTNIYRKEDGVDGQQGRRNPDAERSFGPFWDERTNSKIHPSPRV